MSRITHYKIQPKNIMYWDYYILCHLDIDAAAVLQRLEYWDGTKQDGNIQSEVINDLLKEAGQEPTQDTSRWIYKGQDELQWELMGICGEKRLPTILSTLEKWGYLSIQTNPKLAFDRKKQYCFNDIHTQDHLTYLAYILEFFRRVGFNMDTIHYAIEQMTSSKDKVFSKLNEVYIDKLSIAHVITMLKDLQYQCDKDEQGLQDKTCKPPYKPVLPAFIRHHLKKDKKRLEILPKVSYVPFRSVAEWKTANCGMDSDKMQIAFSKNADAIPITTNSEYKQVKEDTAQSPSGDNVQSSSPSLTFTPRRGRPRPTDETKEKHVNSDSPKQERPPKKPDVDPTVLEQAKATFQREIGGRVSWKYQTERDLKALIQDGGTIEEIEIVIRQMKNDSYHSKRLTIPHILDEFPNQLRQAKVTYINPSMPESEEVLPFDEHTDPRMLSNTDHMKWVAKYGPVAS